MNKPTLLNTSNPHCFVFSTAELRIEILEGIRIDNLDRLRVTLKIGLPDEPITFSVRHNLDYTMTFRLTN
jgi:hypothetical protein